MDSLFNRNTDGVIGSESSEPNTASQHAVSDVPATVVNPLCAGESAGEHAMPAGTPAPAPDTCAYVAEPAPQQTIPAKEHEHKQPSRAANLLLIATLAAVCGLAGGLAGGAIMSATAGGSTQVSQGGMGGGQGGMQGGGAPSADGATGNGASDGSAPSGQAPSGAPDVSGSADGSTDDSSTDAPGDAPADTSADADTSQTSLSA